MIHIAFINASTQVSDAEAAHVMRGLQVQLNRDFSPIWNIAATLTFYGHGTTPPPTAWWLTILDHSDQAGALGYHDLTPAGLPLGKVFAVDAVKYTGHWSSTASHELLEMLVDPWINLTVFQQTSATQGAIFAYEVCDACEALSYVVNDVKVSDFVTPLWFQPGRQGVFDFLAKVPSAMTLLAGGYIGTFNASGTGWTQITADGIPPGPHKQRFARRIKDRSEWKLSEVFT